jgi:CheY-like chemotaxis protein
MTETTKPRILLVEDNMDWQKRYKDAILECGLPPIDILEATNAPQAKKILEEAKPIKKLNIVVLDYNFFLRDGSRRDAPGGNGADFARHLISAGFSGTLIAASSKEDFCQEILHTARVALFTTGRSGAEVTLLSTNGDKSKVPELVIQALQDIHRQSK